MLTQKFYYTHDYENDTVIEFRMTSCRSELEMSFTSEDPDYGTETLVYGAEPAETLKDLASELLKELTAYIDYAYSPIYYSDEKPESPVSHDAEDYYDNYGYTSLIAFEGWLIDLVRSENF